jgi:hypothetical protein
LLDLTTHTSLSPLRPGFAPGFVNNKKGALDSQPHAIKFTSCLPMVGAWLWDRILNYVTERCEHLPDEALK